MREISLHVLDLVRNSLEAGADWIEIEVRENRRADTLVVRVRDNGRGMDGEALRRAADPFYTTRSTRRVGLGLALFKAAAEQCGGELMLESREGEGTTVTVTFQHSHWDREPLGNMAATLIVILAGSPDLGLVYRHTVDGNTFEFSAGDARRRLEDVPIDYPKVLEWLEGYFRQSINNLYGGDRNDQVAGRTGSFTPEGAGRVAAAGGRCRNQGRRRHGDLRYRCRSPRGDGGHPG